MMACSYLSAGGMKSDQTSAACWSPPAMAGCHATETRPTLPSGLMGLQSGLEGLPRTSLPRGLMAIPSRGLPSGQLELSSGPVGQPSRPMAMPSGSLVLPSAPVGLPSGQLGLPSRPAGPMVLPNTQMGLLPPFAGPLPMDLHSTGSQPGPSASEPALDLSTSAPSVTPSPKIHLPSPNEDTE